MQSFLSRAAGLAGVQRCTGLDAELKKATDRESIDAPQDAILAIRQASSCEDDRRVIMRHLHFCLTESAASRWRRTYLGLLVVEDLLKHGDPALVVETAEGAHFDLVQRLTFLGRFEFGNDKRVENMVRRKADSLRAAWLQRQNELDGTLDDKPPQSFASSSSKATPSKADDQVASGYSKARKKKNFGGVGSLVSVGHNEDTSDESDMEDERSRRPQRASGSKSQGMMFEDQSTTDADESPCCVASLDIDLLGSLDNCASTKAPVQQDAIDLL